MRLLHIHSATLSRVNGVDSYDNKGNLVKATRTDSPITCCIQPPMKKSVYQDSLPEGITSADYREIRTVTPIFTSKDNDKTSSDLIIYNDVEYVVFVANPWFSPTGRSTHYEGIMIKRDHLGG